MPGLRQPESISPQRRRIAKMAREHPERSFTSLAHHIDITWLRAAYGRVRKDGAVGVDGQDAESYSANLEENLQALLDRFKTGLYRAPAVRRVRIPKGKGTETRPLGIPTFEDKVLQTAVALLLESVYEEDFKTFSYGFRPGRSAHGALLHLRDGLMEMHGGWVVEVDIRRFFDVMSHSHLREFLSRRVRDGVIRRIIGKWLNAGVLESGQLSYPESGTPQGGVISPLLANVYLHEVIDRWFEEEVQPRMTRPSFMVRYADDLTMVFACRRDAERVLRVLPKRLERFGLRLHPEKTRLVPFRRPPRSGDPPTGGPGTFDFLGFTHYWGFSRKKNRVVKRKTAKNRIARTLRAMSEFCRRHRHCKVTWQHQMLCLKLRGHYAYFGVTCNHRALGQVMWRTTRLWRKWLNRNSSPWPVFR